MHDADMTPTTESGVSERPERDTLSSYGLRLSRCWYGDRRIVHAARSHGIWVGRSTACGRWVRDDAIRHDGYPHGRAKPATCPECLRVPEELKEESTP